MKKLFLFTVLAMLAIQCHAADISVASEEIPSVRLMALEKLLAKDNWQIEWDKLEEGPKKIFIGMIKERIREIRQARNASRPGEGYKREQLFFNLDKKNFGMKTLDVEYFFDLLPKDKQELASMDLFDLKLAYEYFTKKSETDEQILLAFRDEFLDKNLLSIAHHLAKNKMFTKRLKDITAEYRKGWQLMPPQIPRGKTDIIKHTQVEVMYPLFP